MSFMRAGAKPNKPRKVVTSKKKKWDDTNNDLTAYRASPEEIAYRKASHQSKFAVCTHLSRAPGSGRKGKKASPFRTNSQARKLAIMKEVLYEQKELQDVLENSDTMMAVVKDLFGDDPRRFAGFPAVTTAPNTHKTDVGRSLVKQHPDVHTRSEFLSDSVMDASALNDLQDTDSECEDAPAPLAYQPKMNMQRFQQFLEAEEKNITLSTISGQAGMSHLGQAFTSHIANVHSSQLPDQTNLTSKDGTFQTPPKASNPDESLEYLQPKSAINDTNKVNKTKRRVPKPQPPDPNTSSNFSINDLRKVLKTLEEEIAEYETQTGRRPPAERHRQETFSGYTLAIVDSVTKLTRYLKECELRLQAEMMVREQLAQDVLQYKSLVDALTSDIILTQEEFHQMGVEFTKFRKETQAEIHTLKCGQVEAPRPLTSMTSNPAEPVVMTTPPRSQQFENSNQEPVPKVHPREINPFGDHLKPVSSAVLLSPPVRRSRVESDRDNNKQQGSLIDVPDFVSSVESNNSTVHDSYAELPGMCVSSLAQTVNPYSASTMQSGMQQGVQQTSAFNRPAPSHNQSHMRNGNDGQNRVETSMPIPVNSVSVPRPTPLIQSNVTMPFSEVNTNQNRQLHQLPQSFMEKHLPVSIVPHDQPQKWQLSHDQQPQSHGHQRSHDQSADTMTSQNSTVQSSDREFLASQIADLNKQHAEAQKRLQGLMLQKEQIADNESQQAQQIKLQHQQQLQQQQHQQHNQQQRQQLVDNHQRLSQQQLQYEQQQKLIALVMQQQQKIQQQQQPPAQSQAPPQAQSRPQPMPRPSIPDGIQNGQPRTDTAVRQSTELPGYRPTLKQTGLPACPVSPNISPISGRSENYRTVYQSIDSQNDSMMMPASRGITVSLPKVDMDMSGGSPAQPQPQTAR